MVLPNATATTKGAYPNARAGLPPRGFRAYAVVPTTTGAPTKGAAKRNRIHVGREENSGASVEKKFDEHGATPASRYTCHTTESVWDLHRPLEASLDGRAGASAATASRRLRRGARRRGAVMICDRHQRT